MLVKNIEENFHFLLGDSEVVFTYDHDFGGYYKIAENFEDYIDKALKRKLNICF